MVKVYLDVDMAVNIIKAKMKNIVRVITYTNLAVDYNGR